MLQSPTRPPEYWPVYIRFIADKLALRDWTIYLTAETATLGRIAEISVVPGRKHATLRFCAEFDTLDRETQRAAIAHELTECHHATTRVLIDRLGGAAREALDVNIELAIDGIADGVATLLPLPPLDEENED